MSFKTNCFDCNAKIDFDQADKYDHLCKACYDKKKADEARRNNMTPQERAREDADKAKAEALEALSCVEPYVEMIVELATNEAALGAMDEVVKAVTPIVGRYGDLFGSMMPGIYIGMAEGKHAAIQHLCEKYNYTVEQAMNIMAAK